MKFSIILTLALLIFSEIQCSTETKRKSKSHSHHTQKSHQKAFRSHIMNHRRHHKNQSKTSEIFEHLTGDIGLQLDTSFLTLVGQAVIDDIKNELIAKDEDGNSVYLKKITEENLSGLKFGEQKSDEGEISEIKIVNLQFADNTITVEPREDNHVYFGIQHVSADFTFHRKAQHFMILNVDEVQKIVIRDLQLGLSIRVAKSKPREKNGPTTPIDQTGMERVQVSVADVQVHYKEADMYKIDEQDRKKWGLIHGLANNPITHFITDKLVHILIDKYAGPTIEKKLTEKITHTNIQIPSIPELGMAITYPNLVFGSYEQDLLLQLNAKVIEMPVAKRKSHRFHKRSHKFNKFSKKLKKHTNTIRKHRNKSTGIPNIHAYFSTSFINTLFNKMLPNIDLLGLINYGIEGVEVDKTYKGYGLKINNVKAESFTLQESNCEIHEINEEKNVGFGLTMSAKNVQLIVSVNKQYGISESELAITIDMKEFQIGLQFEQTKGQNYFPVEVKVIENSINIQSTFTSSTYYDMAVVELIQVAWNRYLPSLLSSSTFTDKIKSKVEKKLNQEIVISKNGIYQDIHLMIKGLPHIVHNKFNINVEGTLA